MLRFFVHDPEDDFDEELPESAMNLSEFLAARPPWKPALEDTLMVFDEPWRESLLELNPFGFLDLLFPQCTEAANRLEAEESALLRSAGDWTAIFLLLEPVGQHITLSIIGSLPRPLGSYYPLQDSPFHTFDQVDQREALYAYVSRNRRACRPDSSYSRAIREFGTIELPRTEFIEALRREARLGEEVCSVVYGKPIDA